MPSEKKNLQVFQNRNGIRSRPDFRRTSFVMQSFIHRQIDDVHLSDSPGSRSNDISTAPHAKTIHGVPSQSDSRFSLRN
jgi:hypothetical protein